MKILKKNGINFLGLNLLYKSTCYVWFRYIYKFNPLSSLSIFYKNNNNYKSNIKDNNSRNQLNEVDNRINNKNSITKYKVTKISIGDANMLIGTQDDYKNTDEHGN